MAPSKLSEKLDQLTDQELGFEFDDVGIWSRLEQRLDHRKPYAFWWAAAACLIIGLAFILNSPFQQVVSESPGLSDQSEIHEREVGIPNDLEKKQEAKQIANDQKAEMAAFKTLSKKGIKPLQMANISTQKLKLEPIAITKKQVKEKSLFAAEDISAIRASLEQSTVENGRTMTIRAQWQKSPDQLNVNYQALKIKLYEKEKKK